MEFVTSFVDFGTAPEISVDGIACIRRVSANKIRVSYFARHYGQHGKVENRIVQHIDWDIAVWSSCVSKKQLAIDDIIHEVVSEGEPFRVVGRA